jgi:hypothetical protein
MEIPTMATRDEAHRTLELLGVAPIFLHSYSTRPLPRNLDIFFGPPEELFLEPETQGVYTEGRLIPILDDGNFGLVTFYDPRDKSLIQKDVETPGEIQARYRNWQQYLADLLMRIAEVIEDENELKDIAQLVGFRHLAETLACLDRLAAKSDNEWNRGKEQFIAELT